MCIDWFEQALGNKLMSATEVFVPDYLNQLGQANHYYGVLKRNDNFYIIEGEPCVCQTAKRLFPGSEGKGRGVAKFTVNKRTLGELNWLMMRYPLKIEEPEMWERDLKETREHVLKREMLNKFPIKAAPQASCFNGELLEFQKEGLGYLLQNRRCLLADEMGLGKTPQALAFLADTKSFPALIIVPPHLVKHWVRKAEEFLRISDRLDEKFPLLEYDTKPNIHIIRGLTPYELPEADLYIVHYLLLRGWKNHLPGYKFEAVIFDEIQDLRHARTEKYSAASLLASSSDNVIGLSGTPIYNRGAEIWNVMNIIDYHCLGDFDSFTREWCYGYGSDTVSDPELLGEHLRREGLLLRRRADEVLTELPPKRKIVQEIDSDEKVYNSLMSETFEKVKALAAATNGLEKGRLTEQISNEERQATGISKAPFVCDFVKMLLEADEKVLLFAHHHAVMDIYREELKDFDPVFITGRENEAEKDNSQKAFEQGQSNICCISMRAAAGLDGLQHRATCVVFGELDWSPAVHSQAEDRAHRMGQKESVLCYYLVCSEGSDQDMQEALGLKVSQFVGLMGDKTETEEDRIFSQRAAAQQLNKIVERLKAKLGITGKKPATE